MTRPPGLTAFMLGSFSVGMVLMLGFDTVITRVVGMTALIAFMVSGLFLVAGADMLEPRDSEAPPTRERRSIRS